VPRFLAVLMGCCVHNWWSDFWVEFWVFHVWVSVRNLCEILGDGIICCGGLVLGIWVVLWMFDGSWVELWPAVVGP
jgi:hypothetical protein